MASFAYSFNGPLAWRSRGFKSSILCCSRDVRLWHLLWLSAFVQARDPHRGKDHLRDQERSVVGASEVRQCICSPFDNPLDIRKTYVQLSGFCAYRVPWLSVVSVTVLAALALGSELVYKSRLI